MEEMPASHLLPEPHDYSDMERVSASLSEIEIEMLLFGLSSINECIDDNILHYSRSVGK